MLCDDCGRNRAVVHITQIGPDGKIEKNLCEKCAAKYGEFLMENQKHRNVSMNDFLKGVFSAPTKDDARHQEEQMTELVCPNCGMSYRDFQQTGKIGCSVCYATFRRQLEPLLRRIHGSSTHSGKIPHRTGGTLAAKHTIEKMRRTLQECVAQEEYEKAAELRDKIRLLEKELEEKEGGAEHGSK
ncbi:MAG: UvrB/UvrC motif-containing protein [Mitsuokella sp.]|uniref:UvrB/UvrC motif-containing protein n=1 Tax=Mitsuokella sp. TaxID=2049034 RepID=UPI003F03B1C5